MLRERASLLRYTYVVCVVNPLENDIYLNYIKIFVSYLTENRDCTHFKGQLVSAVREIIGFYGETHTKHKYAVWAELKLLS